MSIFSKKTNTVSPQDQRSRMSTEKLIYALKELREIINHLSDPVLAIKLDGSVYYFSKGASTLLNKKTSEVIGRKFYTSLPLEPKTELREMYKEFMKNDRRVEREFELTGGTLIQLIMNPITNENGNAVIGAVVEVKDLTEKKGFEKRQLDFVAFISHELRTPISSALGYLDVVLNEADYLSEEHRTFIERALSSTKRQSDTVEKLINMSDLEQGQLTVTFEEIDVSKMCQEIVTQWQDDAKKKGLILSFKFPRFSVAHARADRDMLQNTVNHLLSNAIKYTEGGSVVVSVEQKDKKVLISVTDTGPGISEETQKELFKKFVRGEHSMTEQTQGTGLGLYLAKRFCELMNGTLTVNSELGKGSTFTVTLPVYG